MKSWRQRVEAELKGADFAASLVDYAYAGVPVAPLYTAEDLVGLRLQGAMDEPPFMRGDASTGAARPWKLAPRYDLPHPKALNRALLADLAGGADALWLQLDACARLGVPPDTEMGAEAWGDGGCMLWTLEDWRCAFRDVDLNLVHVELDAGANTLASAALLMALAEERGVELADLSWNFGFDPLASLARDGSLPLGARCMKHQLGDLFAWTRQRMPKARVLTLSTEVYHGAGATLVQELGFFAATLVHYLQLAESLKLPLTQVAQSMALRLVLDRDVFPALAGLRAARCLWSRLLEACGIEAVPAPWIHAIGSRRSLAEQDPWSNQLRASTQTFAAILGGAQQITTCTFDEVLGQPSVLGRRVARNTQLILAEESHLGEVADPAAGSYAMESLTQEICVAAWVFFQQIEQQGGMAVALRKGWVHEILRQQHKQRAAKLATGELPLTGVSSFAPENYTSLPLEPYWGEPEKEWMQLWKPADPCVMRVQHGMDDLCAAVGQGCDVFALTEAQRHTFASSCGGPQIEALLLQRDEESIEEMATKEMSS